MNSVKKKSHWAHMSISLGSGARGLQRLPSLKFYYVQKRKSRFSLGLDAAKNTHYMIEHFKWKLLIAPNWIYFLVMGSIKENRYQYGIDTQISFWKSPSRTSQPQISQIFRPSDFEFFRFLQHLPPFTGYFHFKFLFFIFFGIFGHYSSDNTKYRYLNKVSILNDTKRYRFYFAPLLLFHFSTI